MVLSFELEHKAQTLDGLEDIVCQENLTNDHVTIYRVTCFVAIVK